MFITDNPIKSENEDKLNRANFSKQLGRALNSLNHEGSLVIGLCGAWGSGKSSILNLAIEELQEVKGRKPIVFKFNPWNFSGQNKLISTFLIELGNTIGFTNNSKEARKIGNELIAYSKFFVPLAIPLVLAAPDHPIKLLVLPFIKGVYWTFEKVGIAVQKWGELKEKTLEEFKDSIDKKIKKLNRKIIVVIDDIDRLDDDEIRQVFQLVKQSANFNNVTYILAFDENRVARALDKSSFPGKEYLEKIVQVHFQVPMLARDQLEEYLNEEIDKIIKPFPQKLWDGVHWGNLYYDGIRNFLQSLRNVKRLINSLKFNISLVPEEINPADFIAVETLRVFLPDVYKQIEQNEALFTETQSSHIRDDANERSSKKAQIEKIIELADEKDRETVKNILVELFPQIQYYVRNTSYGHDWQETWSKERRVCAKARFKSYFFLDIPSGEISQAQLNAMIALADNTKILQKFFESINKRGLIKKLLDRLPDFKDEVPLDKIETFLLGLFNESDSFSSEFRSMFDERTALKVNRVAYFLLKKIEDVETREKIVKAIVNNSTCLLASTMLVSLEEPEGKQKEEEKQLVRPETLQELKNDAIKKIEQFVKNKKIDGVPDLAYILYAWKRWKSLDEPKKYVKNLIKADKGLVRFIEGFMAQGSSQSIEDKVSVTKWRVVTESMLPFVENLTPLKSRVEKFTKKFIKGLSIKEQIGIKLFVEALNNPNKEF